MCVFEVCRRCHSISWFFFLMIRRPPRSTLDRSSAASDVYKRQLLFARELFLEFSLWDLFQGNYTVEQVHGEEVRLYAGLDGNGNENYIIWKTDSTTTSSTAIALNKVSVDDLIVRFRDCLLYTSPSPRDRTRSRMPSSAWKKKTIRRQKRCGTYTTTEAISWRH